MEISNLIYKRESVKTIVDLSSLLPLKNQKLVSKVIVMNSGGSS